MADPWEGLGNRRYVLLTTVRGNGTPVPTPVWVVRDGDRLAVWTGAGAGKVKRIRRNASVTIAPCTVRGRPLGEPAAASAHLLPAEDTLRIIDLIIKKYRLQGRLVTWRARRRPGTTVGIGIDLDGAPAG
ncbi:PPOX class F420-dependent oxidoreductase [Rugosimonospora acidiphila]|uniref:PPOX class F420-dependent oxidoreductase n=1 Tax=Rugosimonospora acidiphila TaxID=556531 RepID=UPI0031E94A84